MAPRVVTRQICRAANSKSVLVVEDNAARSSRRAVAGVTRPRPAPLILVQLHRITTSGPALLAQHAYRVDGGRRLGKRVPGAGQTADSRDKDSFIVTIRPDSSWGNTSSAISPGGV